MSPYTAAYDMTVFMIPRWFVAFLCVTPLLFLPSLHLLFSFVDMPLIGSSAVVCWFEKFSSVLASIF